MTAPQPDVLAVVQLLLAKYHGEVVQPLFARIADLEAQVAQHTRRLERGHRGAYRPGELYEKGDEVMWNGSTFRALTNDPPPLGTDLGGWALVAQGKKYDARGHKVAA